MSWNIDLNLTLDCVWAISNCRTLAVMWTYHKWFVVVSKSISVFLCISVNRWLRVPSVRVKLKELDVIDNEDFVTSLAL